MDGTGTEAYFNGTLVENSSVSASVIEVGAVCLPVPEARAGAPGCHVDKVGQCPDQPPMLREPFSKDPQTAQRDVTELYVDGQNTDFPPSSDKLSHVI